MLPRVLEAEVMDSADEAGAYEAMDHRAVNGQFVDDLLAAFPAPRDVLDVGTGTAQIPIELCRRVHACRVMAADKSRAMLQLARYAVELSSMLGRVQLDYSDAKHMLYRDGMFDLVMCNGTLHHFADPGQVLRECWRVTASGGGLFFRDLLRPADAAQLEALVTSHAGDATALQQQMFRSSLQASFDVAEMRALVAELGQDPAAVQVTSDRHWTWCARRV